MAPSRIDQPCLTLAPYVTGYSRPGAHNNSARNHFAWHQVYCDVGAWREILKPRSRRWFHLQACWWRHCTMLVTLCSVMLRRHRQDATLGGRLYDEEF